MASDMTSGSKKVKISKKEVMLKNKSYFKKSTGDEAGCAAKKGVVTSTNRGKVYFNSWSMDVKFEGENVVRHLDLTTHNHMSPNPNTPPWPYLDAMAVDLPKEHPCKKDAMEENKACKKLIVYKDKKKTKVSKGATRKKICDPNNKDAKDCREKRKCRLEPQDRGADDNAIGCCPGEQAHHIVESHGFIEQGTRDNYEGDALNKFTNKPNTYRPGDAPTVCALGDRWTAEHGAFHALVGQKEKAAINKATGKKKNEAWNYGEAKRAGSNAHNKVFPDSKCNPKCIEAQLDAYHNKVGANDRSTLRTEMPGLKEWMKKKAKEIIKKMIKMKKQLGTSTAGAGVP
jgi:hypothetical protein